VIAAFAFAVGASIATGVAFAAIPDSSAGLVTACYPTSGPSQGLLRVIDAQTGAQCKAGEAKITWASRSFRWQGQWSATTSYRANDVVRFLNSAYIATKANRFVAPANAATWGLMVSAGAKGDAGAAQACADYPRPNVDWSGGGKGCDLSGANLTGANLAGANLTNTSLVGANLTNADLVGATMTSTGLDGTTFAGANLSGDDLSHAHLSGNLAGANLSNTNLTGAFVIGNLSNADIANANLTNALMTSEVNLTGADMSGDNLTNADLTGVRNANGLSLAGANLTGAILSFADFTGVNVTGVIWSHTTCPDKTVSDINGTSPQSCHGHGPGL
jgi:uncharacterized protein YjbI with pentapeptide repeats